tara:strand:- start:2136 stop:2714 length:579 start_codon:yes stop_codon:yes gene_type:complete
VFKKEWEDSYSSNQLQNKNQYPSEEVIHFLMHKFSKSKDKSKINILELGCGWGNNLKFLKDQGFSYVGVDFSESAIKHCKKYHKNVYCCSIDQLPFKSDKFDIVLDRMAIQHNPMNIIKKTFLEVKRVLKDNGFFYSNLVEEANYTFKTTYLTTFDIKNISSIFSKVDLESVVRYKENGEIISKINILIATK